MGDRDQIRRSPATPFVLNFIDDVNQLPSNCQFVKRMGLKADKPLVMCRPSRVEVMSLRHSCYLRRFASYDSWGNIAHPLHE